jgi:tetratricopeptide (TPR) repeat protein
MAVGAHSIIKRSAQAREHRAGRRFSAAGRRLMAMRWLALFLLVCVASYAPHAARNAVGSFEADAAHALAIHARHPASADPLLTALLPDARLARAGRPLRRQILNAAAHAAEATGDFPRARRLLARIVAEHPKADMELLWLSYHELGSGNADAAALWLNRFVTRFPQRARLIEPERVRQLVQEAGSAGDPLYRVLQRLLEIGWDSPLPGMDGIWHALALAAIERAEEDTARSAIKRIQDPYVVVRLRIDRRFDRFVDRAAPRFDAVRAARRQVRDLRAQALLEPGSNEVASDLLAALLMTGNDLKVEWMTRPGNLYGRAPDPAGTDQGWIANARADALLRLGRNEEALKALKAASQSSEHGEANVSQVLNLAAAACRLGRTEYAAGAKARVGHMSGYGHMVLAGIELCDASARGDLARTDALVRTLERNHSDAPGQYLDGLLGLGRVDEAAAAFVAMLEAPDTRAATLMWAQDFIDAPPKGAAFRVSRGRERLLAQAEVVRAIDAVGRRERHRLRRP